MMLAAHNALTVALEAGKQGFFRRLDQEWLSDLQNFVSESLPKILAIVIIAWVLTRVVKGITARVLKVAERHSGRTRSISQVRTLTSVIRATGIGIIVFIATMEVLPLLGSSWRVCWPRPGWLEWRSAWRRRR